MRTLAAAIALAALSLARPARADFTTKYYALIHGKGQDYSFPKACTANGGSLVPWSVSSFAQTTSGQRAVRADSSSNCTMSTALSNNDSGTVLNDYWGGTGTNSIYGMLTSQGVPASHILVAHYNGKVGFYTGDAVGEVAAQINDFIARNAIGVNNLVLIGHSQGGLLIRHMLANYRTSDPMGQYWGNNYGIWYATSYSFSISGPMTGSEGADALYGHSTNIWANIAGWFLGWFTADDAAKYLQAYWLLPNSQSGNSYFGPSSGDTIFSFSASSPNAGGIGCTSTSTQDGSAESSELSAANCIVGSGWKSWDHDGLVSGWSADMRDSTVSYFSGATAYATLNHDHQTNRRDSTYLGVHPPNKSSGCFVGASGTSYCNAYGPYSLFMDYVKGH
jgi:hypothetical protein